MFDKPLKIALLVSLGMHSAIIAPWPNINLNLPKKPDTQIEVTYFKAEKLPEEAEVSQEKEKIEPPPKPAEVQEKEEPKPVERPAAREEPVVAKKTIPVTPVPQKSIQMTSTPNLEGNISYLSYSQIVREEIRKHLYRNYREYMGKGDIALNFVLRSSGELAGVQVLKDTGAANRRLGELCLASIRQAAPFRPFPKELDLPEIAFTITISFKSD